LLPISAGNKGVKVTTRVIAGVWLVILLIIAGAWGVGAAQAAQNSIPQPSDVAGDAAAPDDARVDLYGNEIEPAVGDYRIDFRGEVYERHAPDIEVTRLGAPSL
jgi:hypothetical protein